MSAAPKMDFAAIPPELRETDNWVVWKWVERQGKRTKPPVDPKTGTPGDATDPALWMSFERAQAERDHFDGIGFAIGDTPYTGIDLDHAIDAGGNIAEWAMTIVRRMDSYTERTPSGNGLRVWVRGKLPAGGRRRIGNIEMYDSKRYFTITGDHLEGTPTAIAERTDALLDLHKDVFPETKPAPARTVSMVASMDDGEILNRMFAAKNGAAIEALYRGDTSGHASKSEADLALASHIAFWTRNDPESIDRLFRTSALAEGKWNDREDYRQKTIARATKGGAMRDEPQNTTQGKNGKLGKEPSRIIMPGGVNSSTSQNSLGMSSPWELPCYPDAFNPSTFPIEVFPQSLGMLCLEGAEALACPIDYFAAAALGLAGGAIGRSAVLRVTSTWEVQANLFMAIVGPPGSKKSPSLKVVAKPLWAIDREERAKYKEKKKAAKKKEGTDEESDEELHLRQLTLDDTTREAFAATHAQNPRGLTIIKDELTDWVASLNAYRGGKGGDKQFWMQINTGTFAKVNRKGALDDPIVIPHPCGTITGCLTPGTMGSMKDGRADDGWLDRIVFSHPGNETKVRRWRPDAEIGKIHLDRWEMAVRLLWSRDLRGETSEDAEPYPTYLTTDAATVWEEFYNAHNAEPLEPDFSPHFIGPWSKLEGFTLRFALILSQLRDVYSGRFNPTGQAAEVTAADLEGAVRLTTYFKTHFKRARGELVRKSDEFSEDGYAALQWIKAYGLELFSRTMLTRKFRTWTKRDKDNVLRWLEDRHYIRPLPLAPPSAIGGRPEESYEVNPEILHVPGSLPVMEYAGP